MKVKRFGTQMKRAQNGAECSNRERLRRLDRQVMKKEVFGSKMKRAQNGADRSDRELLRRLERRVMKERSFQIKNVERAKLCGPA